VEVLEPIDTTQWRTEDLDQHIANVRQLYLDCLGQNDLPIAKEAAPKSTPARKGLQTKSGKD